MEAVRSVSFQPLLLTTSKDPKVLPVQSIPMLRRGLSPRRARTETGWLIHATTSRSLTHDSMSTHELGSTVRIHSACVAPDHRRKGVGLALSKGGTCHAWTLSPAIWDICSSHPRICTVCTIRLALSGYSISRNRRQNSRPPCPPTSGSSYNGRRY